MSSTEGEASPGAPERLNPYTRKAFSDNYYRLRREAETLPIHQQLDKILDTIQDNRVTIVVGETGSGKTTQLPKAILERLAPTGKIALTQNRRLAADLVAQRTAEELDVTLGKTVGVRHGRRDLTNENLTKLEVLTDGSLLARAKSDPAFSTFDIIIIDEAHQLTTDTELLLGLLRNALVQTDLKIVLMSATIDTALFQNFFPGSAVFNVIGKKHQVHISYLKAIPAKENSVLVQCILRTHLVGAPGNILVFVAGVDQIVETSRAISQAIAIDSNSRTPHTQLIATEVGPLVCWPLHGQQTADDQEDAIESAAPSAHNKVGRKVILATNIAESSISLSGVVHVIDCCKVKSKIWNPVTESWTLHKHFISKAAANQRAGRAGRLHEGFCIRLCTQAGFFDSAPENSAPAIRECDMLSECLTILETGNSPLDFNYIQGPARETVVKAMEILSLLRAVDLLGEITPFGENLSHLPLDVNYGYMLLSSLEFRCCEEILSLISIMQASECGSSLFQKPTDEQEKARLRVIKNELRHASGDHLTLFNIYMRWLAACEEGPRAANEFTKANMLKIGVHKNADQTRAHIVEFLHKYVHEFDWKFIKLDTTNEHYYDIILQALAAGNFLRVAKRPPSAYGNVYEILRSQSKVTLHWTTNLGPPSELNEWVFYTEYYRDEDNSHLRCVSAITPELLFSATPTRTYWADLLEFSPAGHIKDGLVKVLSTMTGVGEDITRAGMPGPGTFKTT